MDAICSYTGRPFVQREERMQAILAGEPAGEHSQRQTEGWVVQLHTSFCLYLYLTGQGGQLCGLFKQPASQVRRNEMEVL